MGTTLDGRDRQTLLLRGSLDICVLALLARQPEHAYGVAQRLAEHGFSTSYGTIYPLVTRLRRLGLLARGGGERAGGPTRQVLHVTPAGHQALSAWQAGWREFNARVDSILLENP